MGLSFFAKVSFQFTLPNFFELHLNVKNQQEKRLDFGKEE